eukprot:TRINITY_DN5494_c0_g1_i1.p1 TRINITY_DN5494_c0_g1~~TRINITY_DN5494_c0_g1_i1.p1  ORF type:complete len:109 (-),score=24.32 TRINITY_DN5494_c0_g1_i1:57-383(-)
MQKFWGEDVEEYKPERWSSNSSSTQMEEDGVEPKGKDSRRHPFQFIPFGGGSRTCIGNNFSLIEQRIVLMMLLKRFRFRLSTPDQPFVLGVSGLLSPGPLPLKVERIA